jgi:hypothetical protein
VPGKEFTYTGDWQRWNVPDKVEWVDVIVDGAGSGGRRGGRVTGRIKVKNKRSLHIFVGEGGVQDGAATAGGGGEAGRGRGAPGGWSGGGASWIRLDSRSGPVKAVAGGAGGDSGDGGHGGDGGGDVGEAGSPGPGDAAVGNATGGTQIQGGNGGSAALDAGLAGGDAPEVILGRGGSGGTSVGQGIIGGGGGGGGYFAGGGGQAGVVGQSPAGGGGGGSNYVGGLTSFTTPQGGGSTGHGRVELSWVTPAPANQPPSPPTEVKVNGEDYLEEMATLSTGRVKITARVKDADKNDVRLVVQYSPDATFRQVRRIRSDRVDNNKKATVVLEGLTQNTLWHLRLYTQDKAGLVSTNYAAVRFWTNRSPNAPEPQSPGDNATISDLDSILFSWNHSDPDHPQVAHQRSFNLQWRRAGSALYPAGPWQEVTYRSVDETYVGEVSEFKASTTYEWRVRTQDEQKAWGPFSRIRSFFVSGVTAPAWAEFPRGNEALDAADGVTFLWQFRDPGDDASQATADLRYRRVGTSDWITLTGTEVLPGAVTSWYLPPGELAPGHWEWQVRTRSTLAVLPGDWSDTEQFWIVATPGTVTEPVVEPTRTIEARLGCGKNRVHVYRRGGEVWVGEITPLVNVTWERRRDDIGSIRLDTNGFSSDCGALLREIHCWTHELVVFRDGERVAEGPITRITDTPTGVHIEAGDVMRYVYRRLMRQGYNDSYRVLNNVQYGSMSVVHRARQIIMNALAPDDPNVLAHLTSFDFPDDARESRAVPDMAKTAWEEVDSLAATAGLDYSVIGRRIILNDTHRPIGRLAEMRTQHFTDPPVVSEYGMLYANVFGVTNNNGLYGLASRFTDNDPGPTGLVEMLASAYGEEEGGGSVETMDSEAQGELERVLALQAERSISARYPIPLVVRVPDNSTLMPDTPVKINHLVPGVWIPLRAEGTVREIAQWQKLDAVTVTQDAAGGEKVTVTMSPAPNRGQDPDAEPEEVVE